jgi:hypothetical protein
MKNWKGSLLYLTNSMVKLTLYYVNKKIYWKIIFPVILLFSFPCLAQQPLNDTTTTVTTDEAVELNDTAYHSPRKAAIYSAVLPGLGQIYNHKYWKVPIVYAGFGTLAYFIGFNNIRFQKFKQAYKDYPDYDLDYPYPLTLDQIDRAMLYYKRWRDLSILGTLGFHLFQIIDATVDAHLFNWEVGEDLSFNIKPSILSPPSGSGIYTYGLRACLSF